MSKAPKKIRDTKAKRASVFGHRAAFLRAGLYARVSTHDQQTLINIDQDGWITCYDATGDAQPIRLADGDQGTPWPQVLNRTIGNQTAYQLTDITINEKTIYEATCDED